MAFFGFKDLSSLSNVDMTIYRYVTQNYEKVVYMRVRDIAQNAHVSNSSVMRFVHRLGFHSFPEFKSFIKNSKDGIKTPKEIFNFFDKSNFSLDIENRLRVVADFLYQCDNIISLGMGSSAFVAGYAARQLTTLGFNISAVTDPFYPLRNRLMNTSNNAIICFSVSGETSEMIEALNAFINDGDTTIISVTGSETSTISQMSYYSLTYRENEQRMEKYYDLSSQIPPMYLTEALIRLLMNKVNN